MCGCGFTRRRVCVFVPDNRARTIGDEKRIGLSRICSLRCFVGADAAVHQLPEVAVRA